MLEDLDALLKEARRLIRDAGTPSGGEESDLGQAWRELREADRILLRERAALASNRTRVKSLVLDHPGNRRKYGAHGGYGKVRLGKAYRLAISQNPPEHGGLSYVYTRGLLGPD